MCLGVATLFAAMVGAGPAGAAPTDPKPPTELSAYSDYHTPTSITLSWANPTTTENGTPLGSFEMLVSRNAVALPPVGGGVQTLADGGRTDGVLYSYSVRTHDLVNGGQSTPVIVSWYAGGDPVPWPPTGLSATRLPDGVQLAWTNPSVQRDGTPLDDFGGLKVYRNGVLLVSLARPAGTAGNSDGYKDSAAPVVSVYELSAFDREPAHNESARTPPVTAAAALADLTATPPSIGGAAGPNTPPIVSSLQVTSLAEGTFNLEVFETQAWLSVSPASGSVSSSSALNLTVTMDPTGLAYGAYAGEIELRPPGQSTALLVVPVQLIVAAPHIVIPTPTLVFNTFRYGPGATSPVHLQNQGAGGLTFETSAPGGWLSTTPATGSVSGNGVRDLIATALAGARDPGGYDDSLVVLSSDPATPRLAFAAHMNVSTLPAEIDATPVSLTLAGLREGPPVALNLSVANQGYEPLTVTASTDAAWLSVDPAGPTSVFGGPAGAAQLAVRADPTGLALGSYPATVTLQSNDADEPVTTIPVTLIITTTPPAASLAPVSLTLKGVAGGAPVTGSVTLSNSGNEALHFSLSANQLWLTSSTPPGVIGPHASLPIDVQAAPGALPLGSYAGSVIVASDDPVHPSLSLPVQFTVVNPPELVIQPDSLIVATGPGNSVTASITLQNDGASPLNYSVTESAAWISLPQFTGTLAAHANSNFSLAINATGLALGDYHSEIQIASNDPLHPTLHYPVLLRVTNEIVVVTPTVFNLIVPWRSGPQTRTLTVSDAGSAEFWYLITGGNDWLNVESIYQYPTYPGASIQHPIYFKPLDLDPGSYSEDFDVILANSAGTVTVTANLTVTPTPPALRVGPAAIALTRAEGSAAQPMTVGVSNDGFLPLEYHVTEPVGWLSVAAGSGSVGPDGTDFVRVTVNPQGLTAGIYSTMLTVTSNDAAHPTLAVPVTLTVRAAVPEVMPANLAIEEVGFRCATGDSAVRFVELTALAGGAQFRGALGLRVTDRNGTLVLDRTNLFAGHPDGQPWPAGQSWLIATAGLLAAAGVTPDLVDALPLDPLGGVLTLYDSGTNTVLHQFPYGIAGGVNTPLPGNTLLLQPSGQMAESSLPQPRNSAGQAGGAYNCPCPLNNIDAGSTHRVSGAALDTATGRGDGGQGSGFASYDLPNGHFVTNGQASGGSVICTDVFVVGGLTAGTPIHLEGRLRFDLGLSAPDADQGFVYHADGTVKLARKPGPTAAFYRSIGNSSTPYAVAYHRLVALPLDEVALRPFNLEITTSAHGSGFQGAAGVTTQLDILGLPPGATLRSCQGFNREMPTPVELAVVEAVAEPHRVRLTWRAPADLRNVTVYRRDETTTWTAIGLIQPDERDRLNFVDERVTAGTTYEYQLGVGDSMVGLVSVTVPAAASSLALLVPGRLADGRVLPLEFDLPVTAPARIELFDVQGRQLAADDLTDGSLGHHQLDWAPGMPLASGLYLVRLTQAGRSAVGRLTLVH